MQGPLTVPRAAGLLCLGLGWLAPYRELGRRAPVRRRLIRLAELYRISVHILVNRYWYARFVNQERTEINELVAQLVHLRRIARILPQEVARRMGTSVMTVRRFERGEVVPNVDVASRYASAVGVHLTWGIENLQDLLPAGVAIGYRVTVEWGLAEPMPGVVRGVHGSPHRIWLQIELDEGPTVDVPAASVHPTGSSAHT